MLAENHIALKEWGVVCRALRLGLQSILLRKGGIHEAGGNFRVAHQEFWLLPTFEHQRQDALSDKAKDLWQPTLAESPPPGMLRIGLYAVLDDEYIITDPASLAALAGRHVLSEETVMERFYYRTPGLFVLPVRVFTLAQPLQIEDKPRYAGCRSWVDLDAPLATEGLTPVFDDAAFQREMRAIRRQSKPSGFA